MDDNWGYPHDLGNLHATSGAHEFFYRVRLFGSSGYVTFAVKPKEIEWLDFCRVGTVIINGLVYSKVNL